jgi:site-specific recombinase XerD
MQIQEALGRYVTQLEADGRSHHTIAQVRRHVMMLSRWLAETGRSDSIERIDHETVALFLASPAVRQRADGKPRKPTSTNSLRSSVRSFFAFVHAAGYAQANAARLVRRARCGDPLPRRLTEDDERRLRAALAHAVTLAERRDAVMIEVLLGTGIRLGSIVALCVEDVDLAGRELRLRHAKGNREIVAFMTERVADLLAEHIGERVEGAVFQAGWGGTMSRRQVQRRVEQWMARAGVARRVPVHGLRHTFAGRLYMGTGDLLLVGAALGHRSTASTAVYAQAPSQRVRDAVQALQIVS